MDIRVLAHIGFVFGCLVPILRKFHIGYVTVIFRFCISYSSVRSYSTYQHSNAGSISVLIDSFIDFAKILICIKYILQVWY